LPDVVSRHKLLLNCVEIEPEVFQGLPVVPQILRDT
jgi:hypothetical protein